LFFFYRGKCGKERYDDERGEKMRVGKERKGKMLKRRRKGGG